MRRKIIITIILVFTIVTIKILLLSKQYYLLKSYKEMIVTNKEEFDILKAYISNSSDINHHTFTREGNSFVINRKEFSKYFPILYKNGFKVAFLFPNSQCFILSTEKHVSHQLLFCKNRINISYYEFKYNESKIISEFRREDGFWYYLTYRYL